MDTLVVISDKPLVDDRLAQRFRVGRVYQVSSSVEYLPILSGQLHPDILIADMDSALSRELISLGYCALAQQESCRCVFLSEHPELCDSQQLRSLTGRWITPDQLNSLPELLGLTAHEDNLHTDSSFAGLNAAV